MSRTFTVALCFALFLSSCGEAPPNEADVDSVPAETAEPALEHETVDLDDGETHSDAEESIVETHVPEPALDHEALEPEDNDTPNESELRVGAMETTESGLKYEVLELGEGTKPTLADTVTVHYRGELLDGTVFDSSYDRGQPTSFPLSRVVAGWKEGIQLMPIGSKYRFEIPPDLGYGARGAGPIPPNSTLIFYVELLGIQ